MNDAQQRVGYMWVDEDGEQVSSHTKFTAALAFINGWHERVERLKKRDGDVDLTQTNSAVGYRKMSKSGKPPVKLVRVLHVYGDLTPGEQGIVDAFMSEVVAPPDDPDA